LLDGPAAGRRRRREPHASRDRATAFRSWHRAPIQTRLAQANLGERMGEPGADDDTLLVAALAGEPGHPVEELPIPGIALRQH